MLGDALEASENDREEPQYIQVFLSRYILRERPLTGYFIVCCVIEILWTVLAEGVTTNGNSDSVPLSSISHEAAAANESWKVLMSHPVKPSSVSDAARDALQSTFKYATQCFTDLLIQIEKMDSEPSLSTYAWETMSESLV